MSEVDFDKVLLRIGEIGGYQRRIFCLLLMPPLATVFLVFSQVFVSATPDHWCRVPQLDAEIEPPPPFGRRLSAEEKRELSIPRANGKFEKCRMYDVNYTQLLHHFRRTNGTVLVNTSAATIPCAHGWNYDNNYYKSTFVTDLDLVCDKSWQPALATTLFYLGSLFGSFFFGWISDRYGRRLALVWMLIPDVLVTVLISFSPNYLVYTVLRTVAGLFFPALYQVAFILGLELMGPNYRTKVGVAIAICFASGMSLLAALGHLLPDWRHLSLATSLPFVTLFSYYWLIPESPRWLLSKNRIDEAELVVQRIARNNKRAIPQGYLKTLAEEAEGLTSAPLTEARPSVLDALSYPQSRTKFLIITFDWLAVAIVYNGLSYNVSNLGISDHLAFFIGGVVEIPGHLITLYTMDVWGRRCLLCSMMLFGGVACVCCVFVPVDAVWLMTGLAMVGKFGNAAAFSIFYVFCGELLPTVIRSQAIGVASVIGSVGLLAFPQIIRLAEYNRVLPLVIMGLLSVAAGVATSFLPETLNTHLPQTLEEGEAHKCGWHPFRPDRRTTSEKGGRFGEPKSAGVRSRSDGETVMDSEEIIRLSDLETADKPKTTTEPNERRD